MRPAGKRVACTALRIVQASKDASSFLQPSMSGYRGRMKAPESWMNVCFPWCLWRRARCAAPEFTLPGMLRGSSLCSGHPVPRASLHCVRVTQGSYDCTRLTTWQSTAAPTSMPRLSLPLISFHLPVVIHLPAASLPTVQGFWRDHLRGRPYHIRWVAGMKVGPGRFVPQRLD